MTLRLPHPNDIRQERVQQIYARLRQAVIDHARDKATPPNGDKPAAIGRWALRFNGKLGMVGGVLTGLRRMNLGSASYFSAGSNATCVDLDEHDVADLVDLCAADGWTLTWHEVGGRSWMSGGSSPHWTLVHTSGEIEAPLPREPTSTPSTPSTRLRAMASSAVVLFPGDDSDEGDYEGDDPTDILVVEPQTLQLDPERVERFGRFMQAQAPSERCHCGHHRSFHPVDGECTSCDVCGAFEPNNRPARAPARRDP